VAFFFPHKDVAHKLEALRTVHRPAREYSDAKRWVEPARAVGTAMTTLCVADFVGSSRLCREAPHREDLCGFLPESSGGRGSMITSRLPRTNPFNFRVAG
jgi:hypothetical protein